MKLSTLLITGGTGSFGNAFLKGAIKNGSYSEIRVFSRDEKKQDDLRKKLNSDKVKFYIGDVRDKEAVLKVIKNCEMARYSPINQVKMQEDYNSAIDLIEFIDKEL